MPSPNKQTQTNMIEFQKEEMKIPVFFHSADEFFPDEKILMELKAIAGEDSLFHHLTALSSIRSRTSDPVPYGIVSASENFLFPQLIHPFPNCGLRLIGTNIEEKEITHQLIDEIFDSLAGILPEAKYQFKPTGENLLDALRQGLPFMREFLESNIKNEAENSYLGGNMFSDDPEGSMPSRRDIRNVIPSRFLKYAEQDLGIVTKSEEPVVYLMRVRNIQNPGKAQALGINDGQIMLMLHSDPVNAGKMAASMYSPVKDKKLLKNWQCNLAKFFFDSQMKTVFCNLDRKLKEAANEKQLFKYDWESIEGRMFLSAHKTIANYAFVHRSILNHKINLVFEKIFSRKISMNMVYDTPHTAIGREKHFGKVAWIHRNGAARAFGPALMGNHPVFSKTGEPSLVKPLGNSLAYLGTGSDMNVSSFYSANYEIGKLSEINLAPYEIKNSPDSQESDSAIQIYNRGKKSTAKQNAAQNIYSRAIIDQMTANKMFDSVATLEPLAILII